MKKYFLLFAAALVMGMTACGPQDEPQEPAKLEVSATTLAAESAAEWTADIQITANAMWTASSNADWVFVSPDAGTTSATATVTVLENTTYDDREAVITIAMEGVEPHTIAVSQPAAKGVNIESDLSYNVGVEGQSIDIKVMTNTEYTVAVADDAKEWISIEEPTRALEEKHFTIKVAANDTYDVREGKVTVSSEAGEDVITIKQAEALAVIVTDEPVEVAAEGGEISILVQSNVEYTVTIPEECTWITRPSTRGLVETEEKFVVALNELAAAREVTLVFTSELGSDEVVVKQAGNENAAIEIPDTYFSKFLMNRYDANEDKKLTKSELEAITELALWSTNKDMYVVPLRGLGSLAGIEYMTNLQKLDIRNSINVKALDVTKNAKLTELLIQGTAISTIDLSGNPELKVLNVNDSKLTALDVTKNTKLEKLYASNIAVSTIDLSANTALRVLNAGFSGITSIDLSKNTALEQVYLPGNQLTSIDVATLTSLKAINVELNKLTSLDLSKNTALKAMNAGRNALTSINVAGLANLKYLTVSNNPELASVSLNGLSNLVGLYAGWTGLTSIDIAANTKLAVVSVNDTKLTSISTAANAATLRGLRIDGSQMTTYDVSGNKSLKYLMAEGTPSLKTIKVWDEFNKLVPVSTFYKDEATEWEGGYLPETAQGINLSENGNANCYIVNAAATVYHFDATVKGHGRTGKVQRNRYSDPIYMEFVEGGAGAGQTSVTLEPKGAKLVSYQPYILKEREYVTACPIKPESVMFYSDGKIEFETADTFVPGNVVIAATDENGEIIWSWHIWCAEGYDPDLTKKKFGTSATTGYILDRNIGASIADPEEWDAWGASQASGVQFQWGRKDMFSGPIDMLSSDGNRGGVGHAVMDADGSLIYGSNGPGGDQYIYPKDSDKGCIVMADLGEGHTFEQAIEYTIKNPVKIAHRYGRGSTGGGTWWGDPRAAVSGEGSDLYAWGNPNAWTGTVVKTIYDPCPAGWMVPPVTFGYRMADNCTITAKTYGWVINDGGDDVYIPLSGSRWADASKFFDVKQCATGWMSAAGDADHQSGAGYSIINDGTDGAPLVHTINREQNSATYEGGQPLKWGVLCRPVRCVMEGWE